MQLLPLSPQTPPQQNFAGLKYTRRNAMHGDVQISIDAQLHATVVYSGSNRPRPVDAPIGAPLPGHTGFISAQRGVELLSAMQSLESVGAPTADPNGSWHGSGPSPLGLSTEDIAFTWNGKLYQRHLEYGTPAEAHSFEPLIHVVDDIINDIVVASRPK